MAPVSRADRADDAALLAGLALDDPAVSAAFVRRFQGAVFGMAVGITRDPALAEDVCQEVFVRAWGAAGGYDVRRASVLTWLLTITRNAAIDAVRARRSTPTDDELLDQLVQDAIVARSDTQRAQLWALRENISEAQRREGLNIKHDISLPVSAIPQFLAEAESGRNLRHFFDVWLYREGKPRNW